MVGIGVASGRRRRLMLPCIFSLASSNERLTKVSTVTSYQLHPFLPLPCHYVSQSSITLWLQVMSGLPQFPQLPVTWPPLSLGVSASLFLSLASRNERLTKVPTVTSYQLYPFLPCLYVISSSLSLSGFKEWKTYPSFHSYQLPVTPFPPSTLPLCVSTSSITLWLQVMSGLPQFPQLPVT